MPEVAAMEPDWFSPPGRTIALKLARTGRTTEEFAFEIGLPVGTASALLDGRASIDEGLASRLAKVLGGSADFWNRREAEYRRDVQRLAEHVDQESAKEWLSILPVNDMVKLGWIAQRDDRRGKVAECLRFFDVPSVEAYKARTEGVLEQVKFRTSETLKSKPAALAAWLRFGELEAEKITCTAFDRDGLRGLIPQFRRMTWIKNPSLFLPKLRDLCASVGVALVVSRAPSGCRASGATKFVSKDKALLMLSFRHMSDDHFWFSFFHECGHLILHGRDCIFVEGEELENQGQEKEADAFASATLLPEPWNRMLPTLNLSSKRVLEFAVRAGIAPGIVVGQLQHRKIITHGYLNHLKRRYNWAP